MQAKELYLEQKSFLEALLKDMDKLEQEGKNEFYSNYNPILKAQFILMLYTTLESVVMQSIQDIFDKIKQEKIHFYSLNKNIQRLYLKASIKNKERNFNQILGDESFIDLIYKLRDESNFVDIVCKEHFKQENPFKTGSLNIRNINEYIFKMLNIPNNQSRLKNGKRIFEISDNRNKLAHGEISFQECGKYKSIKDLEIYYKSLCSYLDYYLETIASYIQSQGYLIGKD